jgi:hypothetical protein
MRSTAGSYISLRRGIRMGNVEVGRGPNQGDIDYDDYS